MEQENKKFYWIKLRTDFFNQDTIDFLLQQENGCEYVVLYQMLCLSTANSNGRLETKINEVIIPYDIKKIVRDCRYFDYDTVVVALELYKKLGLIYETDDKILKLTGYESMVGSESASKSAIKKREYRAKLKEKNNAEDNSEDKKGTNCPTEYRDKSIEYRDKNIDIEEKKNIIKEKYFDNEEVNNIFVEFLGIRKKLKAVNSERAIKTLINKLNKYSDDIKFKMIERSVVNSWKDVYELKEEKREEIKLTQVSKGAFQL